MKQKLETAVVALFIAAVVALFIAVLWQFYPPSHPWLILLLSVVTLGGLIVSVITIAHWVQPLFDRRHRRQLEKEAQDHQHAIDKRYAALDESKHQAQVTATLAAFQHQIAEFAHKQEMERTRITPDTYINYGNGRYDYLPKQQVPRGLPSPKDTDENDDEMPSQVILPPPVDVADLLQSKQWEPSRAHLFLAMTGAGPLSVAYKLAWHIALAGSTGGGKTTELRLILAQMVLWFEVYYVNPAYAPIKANHEDWRPIAERLAGPVARLADEIEYRLQWTLYQLQDRQEREYQGDHSWHGHPIFLVIDEFKEVIARYPNASKDVCNLLRQARQYEIFVVVAAQDFLIKNIGGDSGARDCYKTAIYFGGDPTTCKALLDVPGTLDYEQLLGTDGHIVVRTKTTQTSQARAPFMSNRALYMMLGWERDPILDDSPITAVRSTHARADDDTRFPIPSFARGYRQSGPIRSTSHRDTPDRLVEPIEQDTDTGTSTVLASTGKSTAYPLDAGKSTNSVQASPSSVPGKKQFTPAQELEFIKKYKALKSIRAALKEMHISYGDYQRCASQVVESRKLRNG